MSGYLDVKDDWIIHIQDVSEVLVVFYQHCFLGPRLLAIAFELAGRKYQHCISSGCGWSQEGGGADGSQKIMATPLQRPT